MDKSDEGFTLIELMISLALFALIAVAGVALVDSVLGVQGRTAERLDQLSAMQRTMLVVSTDLEQIARGDLKGGESALTFTRAAPGLGGPPVAVSYALAGNTLTRSAGGAPQILMTGVTGLRWRFRADDWADRWPLVPDTRDWPRAVEVEITLGERGSLRRVILLPERAKDVW